MSYEKGKAALDTLANVATARAEWRRKAHEVADRFQSPRGVSGNVQFVQDATRLFDQHVHHHVEREAAKLVEAADWLIADIRENNRKD